MFFRRQHDSLPGFKQVLVALFASPDVILGLILKDTRTSIATNGASKWSEDAPATSCRLLVYLHLTQDFFPSINSIRRKHHLSVSV